MSDEGDAPVAAAAAADGAGEEEVDPAEQRMLALRRAIVAIQMDPNLTDEEKSQRRQDLMSGKWAAPAPKGGKKAGTSSEAGGGGAAAAGAAASSKADKSEANNKGEGILEDALKCVICVGLCERPVTSPCQHNFCLACFKRWLGQGKKTCPTCRAPFPRQFADNPRINTLLTYAIRCAKQGIKSDAAKTYARIADDSRPEEAFTTERAVRAGRANAASGRIFVTVPNDHFGPILAEHDPVNGKGVQVGDWWKDRLDCRQWGAHFPHVAGIAGQSTRGAQSVVLSGGYEDDHDEGEWFLYTGSGGRDLSGNKRTNKNQSFDQEFESMNKALKLSCQRGLPVRVVRSYKEKRSSYAPPQETPVRYDGIYRILRCWRKPGAQKFLMCRYLFVRCDNAPAPWSADDTGDAKRLEVPDLAAKEIAAAAGQVFEMCDKPYWDYDDAAKEWRWAKEAPPSQKAPGGGDTVKRLKKKASGHERLLKDFACGLCKGVLDAPLSMPCGHNFCKACLDGRFEAAAAAKAAKAANGSAALAAAKPARAMRARKEPKPCPSCKTDLHDFLTHAQVNTEMAELIRRLQEAAEEARRQAAEESAGLKGEEEEEGGGAAAAAAATGGGEDDDDEEEDEEAAEEEDEDEEAAGGEAGPSSSVRPAKQARRGGGAPASATASEAGPSSAAAAAAPEPMDAEPSAPAAAAAAPSPPPPPQQQEQQPAAAAANGHANGNGIGSGAGGGGRYASEAAQLASVFPDFDASLIVGMLEDQGGDVDEVHAYLKRMKNQLAHAARQAARPSDGGSAGKKGRKTKGGRGGGGGKKKAAAAKDSSSDDAADEEEEEQEQEPAAAAGEEQEQEPEANGGAPSPAADTAPKKKGRRSSAGGGGATGAKGKKRAAANGADAEANGGGADEAAKRACA